MAAFSIDVEGSVAHLKLTRPEAANALAVNFWRDFGPAVQNLDQAGEIRAMVISGESRDFCAGMPGRRLTG